MQRRRRCGKTHMAEAKVSPPNSVGTLRAKFLNDLGDRYEFRTIRARPWELTDYFYGKLSVWQAGRAEG